MKKIAILLIALMMVSMGFLSGCTNEKTSEAIPEVSITSFGAEPNLIDEGETADLTWSVIEATSVTIDNGIGSVSLTGIRIVMPTVTTTYTLTASNGKTTKTATTQIIVTGEPAITPSLIFQQNEIDNTLLVTGADPTTASWNNINITINRVGITHGPYYNWVNKSGISYTATGLNCPTTWGVIQAGNTIQFGKYYGSEAIPTFTVSLRWIPTNKLIGSWTFTT